MTIFEELNFILKGVQKNNIFHDHHGFSQDSPPFLFTNENVKKTFDNFDLQNKRVLTVAASGDHAFEAYTRGAKHVDVFDCNLFQKYVIELKHQMIKTLSYSEFMDYFFGCKRMNPYIYEKVMRRLSKQTATFMECFYLSNNKQFFFHPSPYWNSDRSNKDLTSYISSQDDFNKLKQSLPETINFTWCNLTDVPYKFTKAYDIVHLSNILSHTASTRREITDYQYYKEKIIDKMPIAENGNVIIDYLFGAIPINWNLFGDIEYEIQDFKNLDSTNSDFKTKVHHFDSSDKLFKKDAIFVLEKIKTR